MTSEEMERAIEFLLESQARNSTDIAFTNEVVNKLAETVTQDRELLEAYRQETREQLEASREQLEAYRQETREAINNLIIANEATRDLAEKVAALAITTSHRVTALETARED
jgi:septation ring formation regulator EzrA